MTAYTSPRWLCSPIGKHRINWPFIDMVMSMWVWAIEACPTERDAMSLIHEAGVEYQCMRARRDREE